MGCWKQLERMIALILSCKAFLSLTGLCPALSLSGPCPASVVDLSGSRLDSKPWEYGDWNMVTGFDKSPGFKYGYRMPHRGCFILKNQGICAFMESSKIISAKRPCIFDFVNPVRMAANLCLQDIEFSLNVRFTESRPRYSHRSTWGFAWHLC